MKGRESIDCAVVYFHTTSKTFLIVQVARRGVGRGEVGKGISIEERDFDSKIADVLNYALDSFQTNIYSDKNARGDSPENSREFVKQHLCVNVERDRSGNIHFLPLHHDKGGYSGTRNEEVVVQRGEEIRINTFLRKAFTVAT